MSSSPGSRHTFTIGRLFSLTAVPPTKTTTLGKSLVSYIFVLLANGCRERIQPSTARITTCLIPNIDRVEVTPHRHHDIDGTFLQSTEHSPEVSYIVSWIPSGMLPCRAQNCSLSFHRYRLIHSDP